MLDVSGVKLATSVRKPGSGLFATLRSGAHPDKVRLVGSNLVARAAKPKGKVGVVTLGGSGHEPGLSGFVGQGMLDVSVAGEIFAAPGAPRCLEGLRLADQGAGVLFVVLNHAGDVLSANITLDLAKRAGFSGVQEWLSFYFKSPMTAEGLYPEHDLFIQSMKLKNTLRWMQGEDLITHLGNEYYD